MKRKILTMILLAGLTVSILTGCGQAETASTTDTQTEESKTQQEEAETPTEAPEQTEEPHSHNYTETITTEVGCETDGLKTFTCECGDTYTEPIPATGHIFENYVSNEDATYLTDGTETATCKCDLTDTRTAEGSKLEYTYTDMEVTMYAQQTVNVRDLPSTDGNKVGSLSTNDEVKVTGQADTGWNRIEYNGNVAYVSNSYLGDSKVEVTAFTGNSGSGGGGNSLANHFGVTLPFTAVVNSRFYRDDTVTWALVWNSNTSFIESNFVCHLYDGTQVTISDLSGSKNNCMAYVTLPDGTSGWTNFYYNGYGRFEY